jgi:caffeoyl-CoA O-methyltransferase
MTEPGTSAGGGRPGLRPVTPTGIASARLRDLIGRLDAAGVPESLLDEARHIAGLVGGLEPYLARCTTQPSTALADLARGTQARDWSDDATGAGLEAEMLSGHVEGQTLKMLARLTGARTALEVGMFTGYSALALAEGLPEDGRVVACEIDPAVAGFARGCLDASPHGHKVDIRVGPAAETLRMLADDGEQFDVVFIDADKPGYAGYLDQVLDLLADGGAVLVDNTLLQGEPYASTQPSANGGAIAAFNAKVAADDRLEQVLLPLRDGLTVIRRA